MFGLFIINLTVIDILKCYKMITMIFLYSRGAFRVKNSPNTRVEKNNNNAPVALKIISDAVGYTEIYFHYRV
jgi:hypothetical protein